MALHDDDTLGTLPRDLFGNGGQLHRGWTNAGLRTRPIGRWTFQVTGGDDAADTFDFTVGGVSILSAPVAWTTSHDATATAIATAINANQAASGYYATVSTDTVTIRQRWSGAVTITKVVVGDAAGTLTAAVASSDTWTEHLSGATLDGDEYYAISLSGALVVDAPGDVDLTKATFTSTRLKVTGQAFQLWAGKGVRTAANAILGGDPTAADTWTEDLPWLNGSPEWTIKLAADAVLACHNKYF